MRFTELHISNFRAITRFNIGDLGDLVLIAGPNGSGKSCVFDALRLLKSVYGGYQANEWLQWFGEFQINTNDRSTLATMFRDKTVPVQISATLRLSEEEVEYLKSDAESVLSPLVWSEVTNQQVDSYTFSELILAGQFPHLLEPVQKLLEVRSSQLRAELAKEFHEIALSIAVEGEISIEPSLTARTLFQTYTPDRLGILEFHGAGRTYNREIVGGVSLDVKALEGQRRTQSLYNWQAKYQNVKLELVTTYIHKMLAEQAGVDLKDLDDLDSTLKELFRTFFPDKEYLGVTPTKEGTLEFPVKLSTGEVHDLNDLSSGEKEVVFGYLRLRNSIPRHSTILIDEPELHLNPALLRGFLDFNFRNISVSNDNQLWLVTHSDALLRQAFGNPNYNVFHMTAATGLAAFEDQATPVEEDELQRALIDLVGDVAAYRPYAKVLILEGDSDKRFDVNIVERLFPRITDRLNLVAGESKSSVQALYSTLARTAAEVGLADRFYAIVDKDYEALVAPPSNSHVLRWPRYHIENFLLEPQHILAAMRGVISEPVLTTEAQVLDALKECANQALDEMVLNELRRQINKQVMACLNINGAVGTSATSKLMPSILAAFGRLDTAKSDLTDTSKVDALEISIREELSKSLDDGTWISEFPGRTILLQFVHKHCADHVKYEGFVNLILNSMVEKKFKPPGMETTLSEIVTNP